MRWRSACVRWKTERAIRQLIAAYGPLVDSGASAAAASLFSMAPKHRARC